MINTFWTKVVGISFIAFPLMLLVGFLLHPNIISCKLTESSVDLIEKFHHQWSFHAGHLIVFTAVPFIIASMVYLAGLPLDRGQIWVFLGGIIGIIGAVILAGDKGALCIVLSAFDSLPENEFSAITPALGAIVARKGLLVIFYLLPLLPIGAAMQIIGLIIDHRLNPILGTITIIGLLLLNNPDIEIVSSVGTSLMCVGYIPLGISVFRGLLK